MLKPKKQNQTVFNRRLFLLGSINIFAYSVLIERLYNLQVIQSEKYKKLADNNRVNLSFIIPSRGLILDRKNKLLADNEERYQLIFKTYNLENKLAALKKVFQYIDISEKKIADLIKKVSDDKKLVLIKQNMTWREVATI